MKIKKIIQVFLIILILLGLSNSSFCGVSTDLASDSFYDGMSDVKNSTDIGGLSDGLNVVIGLLQIAGTGISVIMVTMCGIKYILAGVDEKADVKKQAIPIVIGAILLFGAVNLLGALESFTNNVINTDT